MAGTRAEYVIYYNSPEGDGGFEASGTKQLREAMKWLHSIKATDISIFKHGPTFGSDQNDVSECHKEFWK